MKADAFEMNNKVWDTAYGRGDVVSLSGDIDFPVIVKFANIDDIISYTKDGRQSNDTNRTLFFEEIAIPESAYKRPRWRAESGGEYFLVSSIGDIYSTRDNYYEIDDLHFKTKNYFASEQQAKESKFYKVFHKEE